jgi:hypothetical protein
MPIQLRESYSVQLVARIDAVSNGEFVFGALLIQFNAEALECQATLTLNSREMKLYSPLTSSFKPLSPVNEIEVQSGMKESLETLRSKFVLRSSDKENSGLSLL